MRTETGRPHGEATGSGVGGPARCSSARDDRSQPGRWRLRGGGRVCLHTRRGQGECRCDSVLAAGSSAVRPVWSREQLSTAFSGLVSRREAAARARLRGLEATAQTGDGVCPARSRRGSGGTAVPGLQQGRRSVQLRRAGWWAEVTSGRVARKRAGRPLPGVCASPATGTLAADRAAPRAFCSCCEAKPENRGRGYDSLTSFY